MSTKVEAHSIQESPVDLSRAYACIMSISWVRLGTSICRLELLSRFLVLQFSLLLHLAQLRFNANAAENKGNTEPLHHA